MEKQSSFFEPPKDLTDDIFLWARNEMLIRLKNKMVPRVNEFKKWKEVVKTCRKELNKDWGRIEGPGKLIPFKGFGYMKTSFYSTEYARWYYSEIKSEAINKINLTIDEFGGDDPREILYEYIEPNIEEVNIKTIKRTKQTSKAEYEINGKKYPLELNFGADERQTSFFDQDDMMIFLYIDVEAITSFNIYTITWHVKRLYEAIIHELLHMKQKVNKMGYPPPKVRETDADIEGHVLKKKPSGKVVRQRKKIPHSLRDVEFWPNLTESIIAYKDILIQVPREKRLEALKEMIEDSEMIKEMSEKSDKKKLFIKHLVSNLQDML